MYNYKIMLILSFYEVQIVHILLYTETFSTFIPTTMNLEKILKKYLTRKIEL